MSHPPKPPRESLISNGMKQHLIWAKHTGYSHWKTMVFTVLTVSQLAHVMAIRSKTKFLFSMGIFSNRPLATAVTMTFMLQMATIYVPTLNTIFKTEPLSINELAKFFALSSLVFIAVEFEKWLIRRNLIYRV